MKDGSGNSKTWTKYNNPQLADILEVCFTTQNESIDPSKVSLQASITTAMSPAVKINAEPNLDISFQGMSQMRLLTWSDD